MNSNNWKKLVVTTVSILGAAAPFVRATPGQYTVVAAYRHLVNGEPKRPTTTMQIVDGRP